MAATGTVVLDNGACSAKVGYSSFTEPRIVPNCIVKAKNIRNRIFIGDQLDDCKDLSGLYYLLPFQKGFITNWDIQRQVWDYIFGKDLLKVDFNDTNIIVTEPYFNFASIQEAMNEIYFEEYQFKSVFRTNAGFLSQYKYTKERTDKCLCCMVIDTGYSFSHCAPYFKGNKMREAVKRINMGGKALTNHLKEIISYRQLMVMDETYVINQLKEDVCYVSMQFHKDMEISKKRGAENSITRDYVLPDYTHIKRGHIRTEEESSVKLQGSEQVIRMSNERFAVPELLFHPSDVGIQEMGIAEGVVHTVESTAEEMQPHFFKNIVLTGGNCMLPGFQQRIEKDVRSMAPVDYDVSVTCPKNPLTYAWEGGALLAKDPKFQKMAVTRDQYDEHGINICLEKFDI